MEPCKHDGKIAELDTEIKDLKRIVKGNSKPGLYETVIHLVEAERTRGQSIDKLKDTVDSLIRYKIETDKEKEVILRVTQENEKNKKEKRIYKISAISLAASIILGCLGLVFKSCS